MKAIRVHELGGPDVLVLDDVPDPRPGDDVVVRLEAAGVNFVDVYHRTGLYPRELPFVPGSEGAGVVVEAAPETGFSVGDRVASARLPGAYAEAVAAPAEALVPVPDAVPTDVAAAVMVQGITAHYLLNSTCDLGPGDWCVVHAAAGGVGLLLTQMARLQGLRVLGTVSTDAKAEKAAAAGAEVVVVHERRSFVDAAREVSEGGVRAVFDGIGKDTFEGSLDCLAPRGHMVLYGQASGKVPPMDPLRLSKGSLFLTRPGIADYTRTREEMLWRAEEVLAAVASGTLDVHVHERYPLAEARRAHQDLQSRKTTGKLLLVL